MINSTQGNEDQTLQTHPSHSENSSKIDEYRARKRQHSIADMTKVMPKMKKDNEITLENMIYGSPFGVKRPWKIGNTFACLYINSVPLIVIGPQFYFSLVLFCALTGVFIFLLSFVFSSFSSITCILLSGIYLTQTISQVLTSCINPGIPSRKYHTQTYMNQHPDVFAKKERFPLDQYSYCYKCNIVVPNIFNSDHCDDCEVCVAGFDHHCVWSGKCIGVYNLIPFYFFIVSTAIFIFSSLITILYYFGQLIEKNNKAI